MSNIEFYLTEKKAMASGKSSKSTKSDKSQGSKPDESMSHERTVDEIIASLKTQSKGVK